MGYVNCDEYHLDLDEPTGRVLAEVENERISQKQKWGLQNHDIYRWLAILGEEVGEANQAALHTEFEGGHASTVREELIQIAAVAVQIVECLDRRRMMLAPEKNSGIAFSIELGEAEPTVYPPET